MAQISCGECSICHSPGANKTTCPWSDDLPEAKRNSRSAPPQASRKGKGSILGNVKQLQGPIGGELLLPTAKLEALLGRTGPDLLILHDFHRGDGGCESCLETEGCYSLYKDLSFMKYIDRVTKEHDIVTDIFLEYWIRPKKYSKHKPDDSALIDTVIELMPCRPGSKYAKCPLSHVRAHMADTRAIKGTKYNGDEIYDLYASDVTPDFEKFRLECARYFPDMPIAHLLEIAEEYFNPKTSPVTIMKRYLRDPFFKKYSRIHHELDQLPDELSESLKRAFIEPIGAQTDLERKTPTQHKIHTYITFPPINDDQMMDIYALARLLKTPKEGRATELGIFYMGSIHSANITQNLLKLGYYRSDGMYGSVCDMEHITEWCKTMSLEQIREHMNQQKCIKDIRW